MDIYLQNREEKAADLRYMQRLATGLLIFCTIVFLISSLYADEYVWVGFVQATAEAAMIGALADWFAVTALFRYPLGLKIPHTAIVPRRKDQIGRLLGRFVRQNFLSQAVISNRLQAMNLGGRLAGWLRDPQHTPEVSDKLAAITGALVEVINDDAVQKIIQTSLTQRAEAVQVAPILSKTLAMIATQERQSLVLSALFGIVAQSIRENESIVTAQISEQTPWWFPAAGNGLIFARMMDAIMNTADELERNPEHRFYEHFHREANKFIANLATSPDVVDIEQKVKTELLADPELKAFSNSLWHDFKAMLIEFSITPDSYQREVVNDAVARLGESLHQNPAMQSRINQWIEEIALYIVQAYGHEVEQLIANTVSRWNPDETAEKIELQVGRDLQFIRINGTVVGGLAGFVIHAVSLWL